MKKSMLIIALVLLVALAAGIGTAAYYQSTSTASVGVSAADWEVTSAGLTKGYNFDRWFEVDKFAPGSNGKYEFAINNGGTEVPYEIKVYITKVNVDGGLFENGTPILLSLSANGDTPVASILQNAEATADLTILGGTNTDNFKLTYEWPWGLDTDSDNNGDSNDVIWNGKSGVIKIKVVVSQKEAPVAPVLLKSGNVPAMIDGNEMPLGGVDYEVQKDGDYYVFKVKPIMPEGYLSPGYKQFTTTVSDGTHNVEIFLAQPASILLHDADGTAGLTGIPSGAPVFVPGTDGWYSCSILANTFSGNNIGFFFISNIRTANDGEDSQRMIGQASTTSANDWDGFFGTPVKNWITPARRFPLNY